MKMNINGLGQPMMESRLLIRQLVKIWKTIYFLLPAVVTLYQDKILIQIIELVA